VERRAATKLIEGFVLKDIYPLRKLKKSVVVCVVIADCDRIMAVH
jgi:hypothetical protein